MEKTQNSHFLPRNKFLTLKEHEKFLKLTKQLSGTYFLLSIDPLIFHVVRSRNPVSEFKDSYQFLFENLKNKRAYFLCTWYWHIEEPKHIESVKLLETNILRQFPNLKFVHLGNTLRQREAFREGELTSILCNQNCFLDDRIFKPLAGIEKKYDAVYDARFIEFKRHFLAVGVEKLALVYAQSLITEQNADFHFKTKELLNHAHFLNNAESGEYRNLDASEINHALNQSRVGLCLSAVEGAMYASGQYLLSGLPVVSTTSLGGRDIFFDPSYVQIVEATPAAVKRGVDELKARNISPDFVRKATLEKMLAHRRGLISLVQSIYDQEGVKRDFESEFRSIFFNKLVRIQSHIETLNRLFND